MERMHGGVMVEYLAIVLALAAVWTILDRVTANLGEHQERYQWVISLPY